MKSAAQFLEEARHERDVNGDVKRAVELYHVLIERFPESNEALQAAEQLKKIANEPRRPAPTNALRQTEAPPKQMVEKTANRFPALANYSSNLQIFGWIILVFSLPMYLFVFTKLDGYQVLLGFSAVFLSTAPLSGGLILQGEIIALFLSMERNTFEAKESLKKLEQHFR